LSEKDGLKNYKKMKVAKFELRKMYQAKVIEELSEEARAMQFKLIEEE
jgi:spermidine/putrescine-binding protein